MRVQLINLDRRPDRLQYFEARAAEIGLAFTRQAACDGSLPGFQERAARIPKTARGEVIGARALACTESHRAGWRLLLESGDSHIAMLEDDIFMAGDLGRILSGAGWVPADADLVKLETLNYRALLGRAVAGEVAGRKLRRLRSSQLGTGGYVISRRGAERLLAATAMPDDSIDQIMFNPEHPVARSLVTYQMVPAPVVQAAFVKDGDRPDWGSSDIITERPELSFKKADKSAGEALAFQMRRLRRGIAGKLQAWRMASSYEHIPFA